MTEIDEVKKIKLEIEELKKILSFSLMSSK